MNKKAQYGFTILETLVAFSIFSISLAVLLQIYSKGTQAANLGDQYAMATLIAQSKLANIVHTENADIGEYSGEENDIYEWKISIEPLDEDYPELESAQRLAKRKVEVEVSWDNTHKTRSIKLISMKLVSTHDS